MQKLVFTVYKMTLANQRSDYRYLLGGTEQYTGADSIEKLVSKVISRMDQWIRAAEEGKEPVFVKITNQKEKWKLMRNMGVQEVVFTKWERLSFDEEQEFWGALCEKLPWSDMHHDADEKDRHVPPDFI